MTHLQRSTNIALLAGFALSFSAHAEVKETPWDQVCKVAEKHELLLTTASGTDEGVCFSVTADEISLQTDHGVRKIARSAVSKITLLRARRGRLRSLGNNFRSALKWGVDATFSPLAPVGIAAIPVTLGVTAFAAPFCAIGDLASLMEGSEEIRPTS